MADPQIIHQTSLQKIVEPLHLPLRHTYGKFNKGVVRLIVMMKRAFGQLKCELRRREKIKNDRERFS